MAKIKLYNDILNYLCTRYCFFASFIFSICNLRPFSTLFWHCFFAVYFASMMRKSAQKKQCFFYTLLFVTKRTFFRQFSIIWELSDHSASG